MRSINMTKMWQICDHEHIKMNLFRGRRSSTGGGSTASAASGTTSVDNGGLENEDASSASLLSGARSSLCRVFLPRSRTTTSCNLASTASNVSTSSQYSSSLRLTTSSSSNYFDQKSVGIHAKENSLHCPRRTASLSRNLTRRSRSVTMPNIEQQAAHPTQNVTHPTSTLSTFKSRKSRPLPAAALQPHNEVTNMTISKSSSLSQFGTISGHHSSKLKNGCRRDRSVDSLVNSQDGMQFIQEINDNNEEDEEATPVAGTPDVSQDRKVSNQSLDSLLDNQGYDQENTMKKSNSLPKSAFGTLQLKVAQIKAQLDTFKNESFLKTPTAPNPIDSTLHPNTPSYGYEYSLPPNLTTNASGDGESGDNTTDSPLSSSPNRMSPFTTTTTNSSNSSIIKVPPFLPLTTATTSSISSSPSTLSPASSNSLPSISRPQNLKLPQSHSLNTFPNNNKDTESELNRLIFFFDVMSTQEKIAKVCKGVMTTQRNLGDPLYSTVPIWKFFALI